VLGLIYLIFIELPLEGVLQLLNLFLEGIFLHVPFGGLFFIGEHTFTILLLEFLAFPVKLIISFLPLLVLPAPFVTVVHHQILLLSLEVLDLLEQTILAVSLFLERLQAL
jgi:hypothetical protein